MSGSKKSGVFVAHTAFYAALDGVDRYVKVGDMVTAGDPLHKGREEYFTQIPDNSPDLADPRFAETTLPPGDPEPGSPSPDQEPQKPARKRAATKKTAAKKTAAAPKKVPAPKAATKKA